MKESLIDSFKDTVKVSNGILLRETEKAILSNNVYKENFITDKKNVKHVYKNLFDYLSVESNTSFNAAKEYLKYGKTAVLNFANPHYPGGGVQNGARAQEECLCRSSNLYLCISNQNVFDDYYLYNRNIGNKFFSDRLIYTKDVTVFKDDSTVPKMMPKDEWFNVDVITCAAPYIANRRYTNKAALKQLFKGRIKNIFESAIDNDVDVIILGAFGCGAFKNPPELVAKAFHEVIDENVYSSYFKKIVFAIKSTNNNDPYSPCPNIMAFELEFYDLSAEANKMRFCDPYPLEQAMGQIIMPSGKILKGGKQFNPYFEWKLTNKYFGKQFSILGDSISTLTGYNPKGYKVFYDGENCEKSGVRDMKDTWWGKVIDFFGGELLVNNSWSGSRVTRLPDSNIQFPSGCSDERTSNLHIKNITPDVIVVYLGFNDWANGVRIDSDETCLLVPVHDTCFSEAYEMMINKLKGNYPKAEIWCCTLNTTYMSSNKSFNFPYKHSGIHIEEYNTKIKEIAEDYDCKVIDLYAHHLPCDTIDGSHLNMNGMNTLATLVVRRTGGKTIEKFIDCENGQHEYFEDEQYSEAVKYICKKCGKIDFLCDYYDEFYDLEPPSKCSKCQGEIEKIDQTGSYDYYMCKECGNHICVSPFSILIENEEESLAMNESAYDSDIEYVRLPSDITRLLFDNTMKLYDTGTNQKIEMQSEYIAVGRNPDCELQIDNNYISQIHASFYQEDSCWFIMDKNSMNGTWLNGEKLKQNTKYELFPGDVINFAKAKEYVFYKPIDDEPHEYSEDDLLGILEEATAKYYIDNDDADALKIIALTMAEVPIYFPMDYDFNEMFGNIDPLQLKKGDTITTTKDVRMKIITLQVGDEEIVPMFTSSEQAHKGPAVNITRLYPHDYLPIVISMNKSFALNPFGNNPISLKIEFLKDIVFPLVQEKLQNKNEIKDENSDDIKAGTVLNNRYELLKEIGSGGLSTVYLARDTRINKAWAVKIVKIETNNKVNQICDSIIQEAQMMKSFNHPYIPKVADIINTSGYLAIVMDYVEGATLENIVKEYGPQSAEMVIEWAKQLCDVLGYLHSQNPPVIYRDVKPANIILKPEGNISIIDFGIMRTYKPNQKSDTVCLGTAGFAAPEQFGAAQTDCRSDIYALGMTMYNLYSGIRPNGNSNIDLGNKNDALSKGLISIIKKCTELSPDDRYQSCKELVKDLIYLKENGRLKKKFNIFKN